MRKIIAAAFVSLDGVMQAPGGPTEDPTGGFKYGGWLAPIGDGDEVMKTIGGLFFNHPFALLLGRRTYDIFASYWPYAEGNEKSMGELFDRARKYVVTRGEQRLTWQNSERLTSMEAVARVKKGDGPDLIIQGSSTLYPQLLAAGLIDRLVLMTFPVVLGSGKRLFSEHAPGGAMRMVGHVVSARGNIVATYEPAGAVQIGSFLTTEPSEAEVARRKAMADGTW
ncbi:MAG TPA: dihydrofolate reductase family protein [Terriglobales bacterium]|jgi:dihydrofolate reductase|nr:dihydrofolate reductase family protein [Terriglobales bacterium]